MSWHERIKVRGREESLQTWNPEPGEHLIEVIAEPEGPTATRYGERLVFTIMMLPDGKRYRWFVPYREEVGENSLLGQLVKVRKEHGSLRGLRLKVIVLGRGSNRRYSVQVLEVG